MWEYWQEAYDEVKRRFNEKLEKIEIEKSELEKRVGWADIDKLEEYKENAEYYQWLYEDEKLDKEYRLEKAFQRIKAHVKWVNWDEFHEWVMSDEQD